MESLMEDKVSRRVDIDEEMQHSFLDYAMSVIVARALPDARDGLKPVQRRVLYSMYDLGLAPGSAYKKSARIVGEVLGKYHPHGDVAVYEAMARMAQDFSMRYCQVDGQGNFGSIDGDPPAAIRYTEARLTPYSMQLLEQIDRNTVDYADNFDGSLKEPMVLPSALPNLLVNGANGIAVGMATSIPPHHLGEVIDALAFLLNKWEKIDDLSVSDLMKFIKGPDFPTGGIILQEKDEDSLLSAYATGKGRVLVRARAEVEEMARGRSRIVISEIPYQVNKSFVIERIAEIVRDGGLEGISDLRDESDRQGLRIVIELKQGASAEQILKELYKRTALQTTFSINMMALVNGEPRLLTLKQALKVFLEHRIEVVRRRNIFDLEKAKQRLHIVEGLRVAIQFLDEIIRIIRGSADTDVAKERLIKKFKLTQIQAQSILDMPLKRLAALERRKLEDEYKQLLLTIKELENILRSPRKLRSAVMDELLQEKEKFIENRRTHIISLKHGESAAEKLTTTEMISERDCWIFVDDQQKVGRIEKDELPKELTKTKQKFILQANNTSVLYFIDQKGACGAIAAHLIPEHTEKTGGIEISRLLPFLKDDVIRAVFAISAKRDEDSPQYVTCVSELGMVKRSAVLDIPGAFSHLFTLVKINEDDSLMTALLSRGDENLLLITSDGMGIRFEEEEIRAMGLAAAGVSGIKLKEGSFVVAAAMVDDSEEVMIVDNCGRAWRMPVTDFPLQGRYGQGVTISKMKEDDWMIGMLKSKHAATGQVIRRRLLPGIVRISDAPLIKRGQSGKPVITVKSDDDLIGVTLIDSYKSALVKKPRNQSPARKSPQ